MQSFEFNNRLKTTLLSGMVVGLLCLVLTWLLPGDDLHARFWSNLLQNSVFFTMIAAMAAFFMAASITAWAGWYTTFKRIWESMGLFLIVGLVLMLIMGLSVYMGWNHLYHWNDAESVAGDKILTGKASFLNKNWYLFGTIVFVSMWYFFANRFRSLSLAEEKHGEDKDFSHHRKIRIYAAAFLPIIGFTSAAMIWQWIMSVDAHWYSTLFAWYASASAFVSMICLTLLILIYLKGRGYFEIVTTEHLHDLGKLLFAFSIFWTYLWFSQFMLIWYANVGEETGYFKLRMHEYPILFWGNLLINFILPFFVLMRNDTKRKLGSLTFVAIFVFIGHWVDYFQMIKPGVLHTTHELAGHGHGHDHGHEGAGHAAEHGAHAVEHVSHFVAGFTIPGLLEIGTFIGFLSLFLFFVFNSLSRASLVSEHDPYIHESLHHHV